MLIANAYAEAGSPAPMGGNMNLLLIIAMIAAFYFLIIRPQNKRNKAHREMLQSLSKNDEVLTTGGIIGKIIDIQEHFITLEIAEKINIQCQRHAIANILPKGTLKSATKDSKTKETKPKTKTKAAKDESK